MSSTPEGRPDGDVFSADPEVGDDLLQVDWEATPLGPPGSWALSLQTAVRTVLRSRFSMWMAWGPELTFFCNAAYRRATLAAKYPWALGRPAHEVWAEIWHDIGPRIQRVLDTGLATWDEGLLLLLERSGYPEESYHTFSYSALSDDDGKVVGMLCVVSEDTTRVIGERRMATLRDLGSDPTVRPSERDTVRAAVSRLGANRRDLPFALVYLHDDDGSSHLAGQTGLPDGHRDAPTLLAADDDTVWPHRAIRAAAPPEGVVVELDAARTAGASWEPWDVPPSQAVAVPLGRHGTEPVGMLVAGLNPFRPFDDDYRGFVELVATHLAGQVGAARGYAAQQRRADELAALDEAKTTFFANVSHEFRTPLTLMLGPVADLLGRDHDGLEPRVREQLEIAARNGARLTKLVNTLLDFSRIEAGRMQGRFAPTDIATATAELASGFRSAVERADLTLEVRCEPVGDPVYLDADMWERIVLNLLSNALKFTRQGTITVGVRSGGRGAVLTVADTGVGIPSRELPRLFERFHRIPTSWARSIEGSGIGLALVRELVVLHGGTIEATSTEGAGTTVTVEIPVGTAHLPQGSTTDVPPALVDPTADAAFVADAAEWAPPAHGAAVAVEPRGDRAHVLVVDDNEDMRTYISRLLGDAGYRVDTAADGDEALTRVATDRPDLLISDVMMPGLDGFDLLATLRGDAATAALPIIVLSARAGQEAVADGLRSGADDYLVKPFLAADLLARVHSNLTMARLRGHHERWRSALIDSLQEGFFVADDDGTVVEINSVFAEVLGHGPEGLPYAPRHPWWPDPAEDPVAYRLVSEAFTAATTEETTVRTVPLVHRDGHRLWATVTVTHTLDPETGARLTVGTLRDTTGEHYRARRSAAVAELDRVLARADHVSFVVSAATDLLRATWDCVAVHCVTDLSESPETQMGVAHRGHECRPAHPREVSEPVLTALRTAREGPTLTPVDDAHSGVSIAVPHPDGALVYRLDLTENGVFGDADRTLLTTIGQHLATGLLRVHHTDQQRRAALALQHAILGPAALPAGFTARYRPASAPLQVGGDWYDIVDLDDGRLGIVVGDCVGHGLTAATVMGQVRSACRALLLENPSPAAALSALDSFAARLDGARCTTVLCAVFDPATGHLVYSTAGHPPPIVVTADGTPTVLASGRSLPVGIRPGRPRPDAETVLPPRGLLLAYTDGLVERRRRSLDLGIAAAATALSAVTDTAGIDDVADHVLAAMTPDAGFPDDVAMLLYRHPAPLTMDFAADVGELSPTRNALRTWLRSAAVDPTTEGAALIAVGEAIANAVEHGRRPDRAHSVSLTASAWGDTLHLRVTDTGRWRPPETHRSPIRGRGIEIMTRLVDRAAIEHDHDGTTVDLQMRIPR